MKFYVAVTVEDPGTFFVELEGKIFVGEAVKLTKKVLLWK